MWTCSTLQVAIIESMYRVEKGKGGVGLTVLPCTVLHCTVLQRTGGVGCRPYGTDLPTTVPDNQYSCRAHENLVLSPSN